MGIVGFGKLARDYYVPALRRIPGVRVAAVADPLMGSLESARRCFPEAALFLASEDLIGQCALDAVLVASPPSTHRAVWQQAMRGGLRVFMEKPFPMRADLDIAETCPDTGKTVMVNFNRRFWPPYRQMAALARDGAIGSVLRLELLLHVDLRGWCEVTSHRTSDAEGGVLEDLGSQMVDLALLLSGEDVVTARAEVDLRRARLQMETRRGKVVDCDLAYGKANREQIVIHGNGGRLLLKNPNCTVHVEPADGRRALGRTAPRRARIRQPGACARQVNAPLHYPDGAGSVFRGRAERLFLSTWTARRNTGSESARKSLARSDLLKQKLAMIGVDAGELEFIIANLGSLPTLRRMLQSGTLHRLESTAGLLPGSVWPTFFTGRSPGEHGIYHHLQWDANSMRLRRVSGEWLDCRPFWHDLEQRGLRVAILDVPMTVGSGLERGIEVHNWGSHDQLNRYSSNDASVARQIRRQFGDHPMGAEIPVDKTASERHRIRANLTQGARRKGELVRWLLTLREWDLFLAVFGEAHRGGHILWPETGGTSEALLDVYRAIDTAIGHVLEALDLEKTTVILFSLHGMGPNGAQDHFVPRIVDLLNSSWIGSEPALHAGHNGRQLGQRSLMRTLREKIPSPVQNAIAHAVPVKVRDWVVIRQISSGYDWARTPGFPLLSDLNGYLRMNVRGRETQGMLEEGSSELKRYVDWLCEGIAGFRVVETGEPLAKEILLTHRVFPGRRTDCLPDLIVQWGPTAPATRIVSKNLGLLQATQATGRGGNHRPQGFCVILGWDERHRRAPSPKHITDLAGIADCVRPDA
ncbi:MAG TPA: alkaline phosphatase family protein [Alphaproteobacteria bacterium]|nr:alkaline phosphatase family protein [Alphaproteobacteria bacterium]